MTPPRGCFAHRALCGAVLIVAAAGLFGTVVLVLADAPLWALVALVFALEALIVAGLVHSLSETRAAIEGVNDLVRTLRVALDMQRVRS